MAKSRHYSWIEEGKKKGLWDNIHAKRKRGEKPAKPGDKDYPETLKIEALEILEAEGVDVDSLNEEQLDEIIGGLVGAAMGNNPITGQPRSKKDKKKGPAVPGLGGLAGMLAGGGKPTAKNLLGFSKGGEKKGKKKDDSYLETDFKKRQKNNEKARKDMEKMGTSMKNPHFESVNTFANVQEGLKAARKNVGADTCWKGYKAKGTKTKNGREVPNCVKEDENI